MRKLFVLAMFVSFLTVAPRVSAAQDVPSEDLKVPNQPNQRYFLIGDTRKTPEAGFALLLVLPGGDGSAEFNPFVKNIYANALPEGYLVAQLVAVPSDDPNQITWPTAKTKHAKQTFTTESFIANVVKDAKAKHKIDDKRVFTLSWSSGGPAAYTASMTKGTPVKGSLVAMSVFLLNDVKPLLPAAKGQRYYILHSPQDQVCKYFFVNLAKTQLTTAGATVQTANYDGGHGWHGDVFGNIRAGIDWLEGKS